MTRTEATARLVEAARTIHESAYIQTGHHYVVGVTRHQIEALDRALADYNSSTPDSEEGWQPIATAPMAEAVLVFASPFVFIATQHADSSWFVVIGDEVPNSDDISALLHEVTRWGCPTRWMPIPAPPAQEPTP